MRSTTLNSYFNRHQSIYRQLSSTCVSVVNLLMLLDVYGKRWTFYDWLFFFDFLGYDIRSGNSESTSKMLLDDILNTIETDSLMDNVITNKSIILTLVMYTNGTLNCKPFDLKTLCLILAYVFKKFPDLWNMNWMWPKHYNRHKHKWERSHRLHKFVDSTDVFNSVDEFVSRHYVKPV